MKCKVVGMCKLPLRLDTEMIVDMVAFRGGKKNEEVIALVHKGTDYRPNTIPLVRVHSACLTGEVFGSQKCDCGYQYKTAMESICNSSYGIMIYMASQEGRGIGLGNKVRAYQLQEKGADTIEANEMLGFASDERDFSLAVDVLKYFNAKRVNLITNNPDKVSALRNGGIEVIEQFNLSAYINKFNESYLFVKKNALHHNFTSFVQEAVQPSQ